MNGGRGKEHAALGVEGDAGTYSEAAARETAITTCLAVTKRSQSIGVMANAKKRPEAG